MVLCLGCTIEQGSVMYMLTCILLAKEGPQRAVLQSTSTALTTNWDLLVLQRSLKVSRRKRQPFPTATDSNSIVLGLCIRDSLLLSLTMADNRKQQRCERIWLSSHLKAALAIRPNSRKWLAWSACKSLCEQRD